MLDPSTDGQSLMSDIRARHPGLREALVADARVALLHRGERREFRSRTLRSFRCFG